MGQYFVGAVSDEYLIRVDPVAIGNRCPKPKSTGIWIETQGVSDVCLDRSDDMRRRAVRILVGVELHEVRYGRLFAGDIGS